MKTKQLKFTRRFLTIGLLLFFLAACNNSNYNEKLPVMSTDVSTDFEAVEIIEEDNYKTIEKDEIANSTPPSLKIIKSANARYKVKEVKKATKKIKLLIKQFDAYISDLRFENNPYQIENRFTIKVPQIYFENLLDSINNIVEFVDYENITTKDVTEEYIDIETRLKTKLEVKQRYETILRKNAKTVEDILATEEKLRIIQEEIESAQGRLKYLSNKVSYSTIQIDLYETVEYTEEPISYKKTFLSKIKDGFSAGLDIIEAIILGIIYIWPLIIVGVLLFFYIKKRVK